MDFTRHIVVSVDNLEVVLVYGKDVDRDLVVTRRGTKVEAGAVVVVRGNPFTEGGELI